MKIFYVNLSALSPFLLGLKEGKRETKKKNKIRGKRKKRMKRRRRGKRRQMEKIRGV